MPKIKFTAFTTNTKTGKRSYEEGETKVSHWIPRRNYEESVRKHLGRQGYTDTHVDDYSVTDD